MSILWRIEKNSASVEDYGEIGYSLLKNPRNLWNNNFVYTGLWIMSLFKAETQEVSWAVE